MFGDVEEKSAFKGRVEKVGQICFEVGGVIDSSLLK